MSDLLSPAEQECPGCEGVGRSADFSLCRICDGIGRTWLPEGPSFGCSLTLTKCGVGDLVELYSGELARIHSHNGRGPTTRVNYLDMLGAEMEPPVAFPGEVGVRMIVKASYAKQDKHGRGKSASRRDNHDPLQR